MRKLATNFTSEFIGNSQKDLSYYAVFNIFCLFSEKAQTFDGAINVLLAGKCLHETLLRPTFNTQMNHINRLNTQRENTATAHGEIGPARRPNAG